MPADAPLGGRQLVDLFELDLGQLEHDELRNPHARLDDERMSTVGVEHNHLQLAAVARVDQPRGVDDRDPVSVGEPGARLHEAGVARRDRDCEPRADDRPLPGRELDPLAGGEIEPGVAEIRPGRQDRVVASQLVRAMRESRQPRCATAI